MLPKGIDAIRYISWLYFDSKTTTYSVLDQLRQDGINFITIRRRGAGIIRRILNRAKSDWTSAVIDTKQRSCPFS